MLILNYSKNLNIKLNHLKYLNSLNLLTRNLYNDKAEAIKNHLKTSFQKVPNTKVYEPFWYDVWEQSKLFSINPDESSEQRFSMILPPPNITGNLHLGHALTAAVEDAVFRYQKLKNPKSNSIFVPGYDHAGIGMFSVLDKLSLSKFNKRISDYSRDEFDKFTTEWKEERIRSIRDQLKLLGTSLDFSNEKFTLDEQMSRSVREAFVRLFDKGLIYRDNGIVNWCFHLNSTISDIEVDWINVNGKKSIKFADNQMMDVGVLYNVSFKLQDSSDEILVATTRPYTMPGDVAVAVNSNDTRYTGLIGRKVINPFTNRLMPIIADHRVSQELGTGIVKITPSCSLIDFQIGQTHKLDIVEIFDSKGNLKVDSLNEDLKYLNGLNRFKLNEEVIKILKTKNQLKSEVDHQNRIPICSKSGDLIEYRILPQWYLNVEEANKFIKEKLNSNEIDLIPSNHKNTLLDWINKGINKPWCISRQINWGHKIPMYKFRLPISSKNEIWIAANSLEEAKSKFKQSKYKDQQYTSIEQEQDVLDTWFSSSLIPFCYFGWPESTQQFENYYPLTLMETGFDILKFWVHKMLITGYYLTDQLPFKRIFLHGMIVDANGKKMSKSLGNVIDPIDFINGCTLKELQNKLERSFQDGYLTKDQLKTALKNQKNLFPKGLPLNSADGLRLCLYEYSPKNEVIKMDVNFITKNRNLINKIWQSFNFLLFIKQKMEDEQKIDLTQVPKFECIERREFKEIDKWILSCLASFVSQSKIDYENYDLDKVYRNFIDFFLHSYCDVYMELIKPSIYNEDNQRIKLIRFSILKFCLSTLFSTIHPMVPFVTEELYQKLNYLDSETYQQNYTYKSIYLSSYPNCEKLKRFIDHDLEDKMTELNECASRIRWINLMSTKNKIQKDQLNFRIQSTDDILLDFLDSFKDELKQLGRNSNIEIDFNPPFLLDDGMSTEYVVDKTLILKVNDHLQIVVDTADYDLVEIFKRHIQELFDKKMNEQKA